MALSLYDISVPNYLQILKATGGVLEKGAEHARAQGLHPDAYVELRLVEDMAPFRFQVLSVWHHSLGAIRGIEAGEFNPPPDLGTPGYADLQDLVAEAIHELEAVDRDALNTRESAPVHFRIGDFELPFTSCDFVQSFSLPNFYFHATTTYALLRREGVSLGKSAFLGPMRVRKEAN